MKIKQQEQAQWFYIVCVFVLMFADLYNVHAQVEIDFMWK